MARYKDGLKVATCLFEAAIWHYAVGVRCGCGHRAAFQPYGLWWRFHRKGWNDDLQAARARFWCRPCRLSHGRKVRPGALRLIRPYDGPLIELPLPDEREWKRVLSRFRG